MDKVRLTVAMPVHRTLEGRTAYALCLLMYRLGMLQQAGRIEHAMPVILFDTLLPRGRSDLVEAAKEQKATHVLWVDSDMVFPPNTAELLLRWELPLIGANCVRRAPPFMPTARDKSYKEVWTTEAKARGQVLESVNACGFGVVLTAIELFDQIEKPWFMVGYDSTNGNWMSEDIYFFTKAINAGFQPMIDHQLSWEIRHLGELPADWHLAHQTREMQDEGVMAPGEAGVPDAAA